jgi:thioredoxin 1
LARSLKLHWLFRCFPDLASLDYEEILKMSDNIQVLTDDSFDQAVADASLPILVDFWADWCGPCKAVAPILAELSEEMSAKLSFAKINVDQNPATPSKFKVRSIPCLIVFRKGEEIGRVVGHKGKQVLMAEVEKML